MAITQNDLDTLDSAIATSELEVEIDGRRVKYRSIPELMAARQHVASVLNASSRPQRSSFKFRFSTSRGD